MSKQTQRLWLGEEKQDVILRDVVSCSGNMTSGREVLSWGPRWITFCSPGVALVKATRIKAI